MHILPCDALQRHRSCDTYPRISPGILRLWAVLVFESAVILCITGVMSRKLGTSPFGHLLCAA